MYYPVGVKIVVKNYYDPEHNGKTGVTVLAATARHRNAAYLPPNCIIAHVPERNPSSETDWILERHQFDYIDLSPFLKAVYD